MSLCALIAVAGSVLAPASAASASASDGWPNLSRLMMPATGPAAAGGGGITVQYTGNWSGYGALQKSGDQTFTSIIGTFKVPAVHCNRTPHTFSYHWVGLDGWYSGTVEQVGVAADCAGTKPRYAAWWEMYPEPFQFSFSVHPGDVVEAAVHYVGRRNYELGLNDLTTGKSFLTLQKCPVRTCSNSSAEAITEGYYFNPSYAGTSDFGSEQYADVIVSDSSGHVGGLQNRPWQTSEFLAMGESGAVDTTPGPLSTSPPPASSSDFAVYWNHQN